MKLSLVSKDLWEVYLGGISVMSYCLPILAQLQESAAKSYRRNVF